MSCVWSGLWFIFLVISGFNVPLTFHMVMSKIWPFLRSYNVIGQKLLHIWNVLFKRINSKHHSNYTTLKCYLFNVISKFKWGQRSSSLSKVRSFVHYQTIFPHMRYIYINLYNMSLISPCTEPNGIDHNSNWNTVISYLTNMICNPLLSQNC